MSCWASARSPATLTDVQTSRLANWSGLRQAWQNSVCLSWFMPSVYYKTYLLAVSIALLQSLSLPLFWCCDSVNQTLLWSVVESRRASINPRFTRECALIMDWLCFFSSRKGMISLPDRNPLLSFSSAARLIIMYAVCSSAQAYLSNALSGKGASGFCQLLSERCCCIFWLHCSAQKVKLYGKEQKIWSRFLRIVIWTCSIYCEMC